MLDTILAIDSLGWSLIASTAVLLLYFAVCLLTRKEPDLVRGITIAASCFGVIAAISLAWVTYRSAPADLGVLHDQKGPICIGAFAMAWVSVSAAYKAALKHS